MKKPKIYGEHGLTLLNYNNFQNYQAKWLTPNEDVKTAFFQTSIANIGKNKEITFDCVGINSFNVRLNGKFIGKGEWPNLSTFKFFGSDGDILEVEVQSLHKPIVIGRYY